MGQGQDRVCIFNPNSTEDSTVLTVVQATDYGAQRRGCRRLSSAGAHDPLGGMRMIGRMILSLKCAGEKVVVRNVKYFTRYVSL